MKEIDINKTAKNVDNFFKNKIQIYLARAGEQTYELDKPQSISTAVNVDDELIRNYQVKLVAISNCLSDLTQDTRHPYQKILKGLYIKGLKPSEIQIRIGYSPSRYRDFKRQALNEFANRLIYWDAKFKANLPVLLIYKENKSSEQDGTC